MRRTTWPKWHAVNWIYVLIVLVVSLSPSLVSAQEAPPVPEEPGWREDGAAVTAQGTDALAIVGAAFSGGPSYDSGWVRLAQDTSKTLTHDLGGSVSNYVVLMDYKASGVDGVNQRYYGGADFGTNPAPGHSAEDRVGAYWRSLTTSTITVYRRPEDSYAEFVRIRIWVDPSPDYDSGWVSLTPGASATTLNHGLGGSADDYVVVMDYKSVGSGINQRYYGGADFGAKAFNGSRTDERVGVYWRSLSNTSITLFRRAEDDYADQVRVRIWKRPRPTYDSGWVTINPNQAKTLTHNIGGDSDNYVVDMQYRSGGSGVNQRYYGGADFGANPAPGANENDRVGAYWRTLTDSQITVYRRPEDIYAPEVRIRIWHYWQPTAPDYDSGWVDMNPGASATILSHNLGGSADNYLVDMQYKASGVDGINQRYYGGADFGASPAPGHSPDDRVSAYWRSLTSSSISVFRRDEDSYAEQVRIRIWAMPKPDYDSGWVAIGQNVAMSFAHNLGGDIGDYLVDMQYRSSGTNGINQRYYGGADFGVSPAPGHNPDDRVGVYWRTLTNSSITVYRRPEDDYGSEVRIRIWRLAKPAYDSGWVGVNQNQAKTLTHQVGDVPEAYFLSVWQKATGVNGVNHRHYGGADFGANPPSGYSENDRVGAYWRSLKADSITVYRRPEDGFAGSVRVRIWNYSKHLYLPLVQK